MKSLFLFTFLTCLILSIAALAQPRFEPPIDQPINFPDTDVGNASRLGLTVMGAGQLWNLRFDVNNQSFSVEPPQRNVGAREAFEFTLIFSPQQAGQVQGLMRVTAVGQDGDGHAFEVQLNGNGVGEDRPEIAVEPEEVQIEIEIPEQEESVTITVTNTGNEILEIEWELEEVEWLYLRGNARRRSINPGSNYRIGINTSHDFPENGEHLTTLIITSNDPDRPEFIVPITMIAQIPEITTQTIELNRGWNIISTNRVFMEDFIDEEGPDMQLIFGDIIEQISHIKDWWGRFCSLEFDYWGIDRWETDQGYMVRTLEETELEVTGALIPWDREIFLRRGWNIISYYPSYESDNLLIALWDLVDRDLLLLAKDGQGRFVNPDFGFMPPRAHPGQGFMVKVTQNCRFSWWPDLRWGVNNQIKPENQRLSHFDFDLETAHSSNNMSVVIRTISADNAVPDGAEIACFIEDGKIAGAGLIQSSDQSAGLTVWGDELLTDDEVEGFKMGEKLTFRMWDPIRNEEYPVSFTVVEGENKYTENGILICDGKVERNGSSGFYLEQFAVKAIYPNPFNSNLTVDYCLFESNDLQVGLYSVDGRLLKSVNPEKKSIGNHTVTINAADLSTGVYVVKISIGDQQQMKKVVLIR